VRAVLIGNGPSRKGFNLDLLKTPKTVVFGCNKIVDDFHPNYVVAIDEPVIEYLRKTSFPQHRIITPPEDERWEPMSLHPQQRIRSNVGVNCIYEAAKRNIKEVYLLGYDFLIKGNAKTANVYAGQPLYENTLTEEEGQRRLEFFRFVVKLMPETNFVAVFPSLDNVEPAMDNLSFQTFDQFKSETMKSWNS